METSLSKWKIKLFLKLLKRDLKNINKRLAKIKENADEITKEERKDIDKYKKLLIDGIVGDPEKDVAGFIALFELTDEEGKMMTRESFEEMEVEELAEATELLIKEMEKEV